MTNSNLKTSVLLGILALFLVVLGVIGWREYVISKSHSAQTPTLYSTLEEENAAYKAALVAEEGGHYDVAIASYLDASSTAKSVEERFVVQIRLAGAYIQANRQQDAVALLKSLAADTTYTPPLRAYAVYLMGSLFSGSSKDGMTQAIFSTEPYKSLSVDGNTPLSYRRLFGYAARISPNAYSDVQIAYWYAGRARASYQNPSHYASSTAEYIRTAHAWLTKADTDPSWDNTTFASVQDRLFLLLRRAMTVVRLSDARDPAAGDPETIFKQLIAQTPEYPQGSLDAYARLQYAYYLYQGSGSKRAADIAQVLAPLAASNRDVNADISARTFLASSAKDASLGNRDVIVGIAAIDPVFKQYLSSLGWSASDFAKK